MDIRQKFFKETDIPYTELEKLNITKRDILSLDRKSLEALLSGGRTGLLDMKLKTEDGDNLQFKGKISLYRKDDGSTSVKIHPMRKEIDNDLKLKPVEIARLENGELITKNVNNQKYIVQLDPDTKELLRAKTSEIKIQTYIQDYSLSKEQKAQIKNGETISLGEGKNAIDVRLDLNNPRGLSIIDYEQKKKIEYDRANPHIIGTIHTDQNIAEYNDYMKKQNSDTTFKMKF